tara:strand:- start:51 stop:551 length:501 start_codon:yes stop_codon:yes gene_type:complete
MEIIQKQKLEQDLQQELDQKVEQDLDIEQEKTCFDIEELLRHEILEFNDYRRDHPDELINLSERSLSGLYLGSANFRNCNLSGSNLNETKGDQVDFSKADLRDTRFRKANYRFICLYGAKIKEWQIPMLLQALGVEIEVEVEIKDDRDLSITIRHSKKIKIETESD